jgi:hypothetical protein
MHGHRQPNGKQLSDHEGIIGLALGQVKATRDGGGRMTMFSNRATSCI